MLDLVANQLLDRFEIQAAKRVYNFPFLMGQGVWLDSDKLGPNDEVREVLKHGTLSIGYIGLAETLLVTALYGHHHGESDEMQQKGLQIVKYMRDYCDRKSQEMKMNFTLLATPAEEPVGRFIRMWTKSATATSRASPTATITPTRSTSRCGLTSPPTTRSTRRRLTTSDQRRPISYVRRLDGDTSTTSGV